LAVDGANADLIAYEAHCQVLRTEGVPTIPSRIGIEKKINPFLRSHTAGVTTSVQQFDVTAQSATDIFAALRQWKNNFR
jgi:hydroxyacylglutathione hydrolase